jgi:hypothetical protein
MSAKCFPFWEAIPVANGPVFPTFDAGGCPSAAVLREAGTPAGETAYVYDGPSLLYLFGTTQSKRFTTATARKAETLYQNLDSLIKRRGLLCVAFATLTHAENLTCRVESQRRFNSLSTSFFRRVEGMEWIAAVERQLRGAIHYHLAVAFPWDVRTGFDFQAYAKARSAKQIGDREGERRWKAVYVKSATPALRRWWYDLRCAAPKYGFGRCETIPVKSNAEGVARYVGGYVGKELANRDLRDRGLRTVRYSLAERPWASRWSWAAGGQAAWRRGCQVLGAVIGTDDLTEALGKRWAWHWREHVLAFSRWSVPCLVAVEEMLSDHCDLEARIVKASALARAILAHEEKHGTQVELAPSEQGPSDAPEPDDVQYASDSPEGASETDSAPEGGAL